MLDNLAEDFLYITITVFKPKTSDSETNATSIFELKVRFLKFLIQSWQPADLCHVVQCPSE